MPPYKRQHYLPASYLKYFSADQTKCSRKSWIWRFDGHEQKLVPVESECFADYHYSRKNPAAAERGFHRFESCYCESIDSIRAGRELADVELGNLLVSMFDL